MSITRLSFCLSHLLLIHSFPFPHVPPIHLSFTLPVCHCAPGLSCPLPPIDQHRLPSVRFRVFAIHLIRDTPKPFYLLPCSIACTGHDYTVAEEEAYRRKASVSSAVTENPVLQPHGVTSLARKEVPYHSCVSFSLSLHRPHLTPLHTPIFPLSRPLAPISLVTAAAFAFRNSPTHQTRVSPSTTPPTSSSPITSTASNTPNTSNTRSKLGAS